jgi:RNA polymerase sigma-70 factor (ECF subfamily)
VAQRDQHADERDDGTVATEDVTSPNSGSVGSSVDTELIRAAQHGDEDAYTRLVAAHRTELHAHCYRMLGSNADAEDALQEALVRAWRGLGGFEGRSSLRGWLYAIATNSCLKIIERRRPRVLPIDYSPAADPHDDPRVPVGESQWLEPYPAAGLLSAEVLTPEARYEQRESVELAFIAALQHLPPAQRAALILRDVLGFSGAETADMLGTTATSVYSSLQRAHKTVSERVPDPSQQATLRALGDDDLAVIVQRFVEAWQNSDVDGLVAMLTEDATFSMPPMPEWYRGTASIATFLAAHPLHPRNRWRLVPTFVSGQLAFGHYLWDEVQESFRPHSLDVITLRGDRIAATVGFFRPDLFAAAGLADAM